MDTGKIDYFLVYSFKSPISLAFLTLIVFALDHMGTGL